MANALDLLSRDGTVGLRVRAKPRARHTRIIGVQEGALVVSLAAPPHEGQANRELLRFLSDVLDVPLSRIELTAGASGKTKLIRVHAVDATQVERQLLALT
jgi:uncharacterized protein (TIGR00251 family)